MANPSTIPEKMAAVLLTGHGGFDKLDCRADVPTPKPGPGEVLIQVRAAGVNNTDINTRIACAISMGHYQRELVSTAAPE